MIVFMALFLAIVILWFLKPSSNIIEPDLRKSAKIWKIRGWLDREERNGRR